MCYRMSEISRHPVVAATRALRFADHVTKRNEGSGNENARIPFKVLLLKVMPIIGLEMTIDIATLCWVPRACNESSKSFSFCRTFTAPATVTLHKIHLNKIPKERNLNVSKVKQFLVCKCSFVCSKQFFRSGAC